MKSPLTTPAGTLTTRLLEPDVPDTVEVALGGPGAPRGGRGIGGRTGRPEKGRDEGVVLGGGAARRRRGDRERAEGDDARRAEDDDAARGEPAHAGRRLALAALTSWE